MTDNEDNPMNDTCAAHPERAAVYECDGCKKLLCEECMEEGHRLLFCRHCALRPVGFGVER